MITIAVVDEKDPGFTANRWHAVEISTPGGYVTIKANDHARAVKMAKAIHRAVNNGTNNRTRADYEDRVLPENR